MDQRFGIVGRMQSNQIVASQKKGYGGRAKEDRGQQGTAKPNVALPKGGSGTAPPKPPPSQQKN